MLAQATTNMVKNNIKITKGTIKLPKIDKPIKILFHRPLPKGYKIKNITVSRNAANEYYVAIMFKIKKEEIQQIDHEYTHIGLDYKMDGLYMDSDGNHANMPKYYRKSQEKLAKAQRKLAKKKVKFEKVKPREIMVLTLEGKQEEAEQLKNKKVSNNYLKQKRKVGKISTHIKNQRKDYLQKESKKFAGASH